MEWIQAAMENPTLQSGADLLLGLCYFVLALVLLRLHPAQPRKRFAQAPVVTAALLFAGGASHLAEILAASLANPGVVSSLKAATACSTVLAAGTLVPVLLSLPSHQTLQEAQATLDRERVARETAQTALEQSLEEQRKLHEQFLQSQKMEAVGRLAGGIAHDFNNLLTVITGYSSSLLASLPQQSDLRDDVLQIWSASERAARLTRQLLAFSRKQELKFQTLLLSDVVRGMQPLLQRLIGEDLRLEVHLPPRELPVRADPGHLEQVILNLAVNARDAMPKGGVLTVRVGPGDSGARCTVLSVQDTGVGMDADTLSHVFEPFYTTKGPDRGTGLGLATVYGIVQQMEGSVRVESQPGRGTTFRISLPAVPGAPSASSSGETRAPFPTGHGETILLVEDDPSVRQLAHRILRVGGYQPEVAESPEQALEIAPRLEGRVRLLLTDVVLPGMSGYDLEEGLRPILGEVPAIFMSGYSEHALLQERRASAFLQKPFTPEGLLRAVREALDGKPPAGD